MVSILTALLSEVPALSTASGCVYRWKYLGPRLTHQQLYDKNVVTPNDKNSLKGFREVSTILERVCTQMVMM